MNARTANDQERAEARDASKGTAEGAVSDGGEDRSSAWHRREIDAVLNELTTRREGLADEEAARRLERYGRNRIGRRRHVTVWQVLLHQFTSPLIYVLLGALVVTVVTSLVTGEPRWADGIVIGLVLVVNGTVGFIQEYRAEHAVEALMQMVAPKARVRRGGEEKKVEAATLVPGDVLLLGEGDVVAADARLMSVEALQVDESALTGESVPVGKHADAMPDADADLPPGDQRNMAFMGTAVTSGKAAGVVAATAKATQIGRIAQQVEEAGETQTPLQRRIQRLAVLITWGILVIAAIAMVVGLAMGRDWTRMVTLAVALAVAAIPAGLPIVVTVALAIGVRRMAQRHAVIRQLPAVDTLGSCTTIVSDKTGTLTRNRMRVEKIAAGDRRYEPGDEGLADDAAARGTVLVGALCHDTDVHAVIEAAEKKEQNDAGDESDGAGGDEQGGADPMERALILAAWRAGFDPRDLESRHALIERVPFKTEQRFMATVREAGEAADGFALDGEGPLVLVKGAPEVVVEMCDARLDRSGRRAELNASSVAQENDALADEGLRVLAMAVGRGEEAAEGVKRGEAGGLTLLGLQGLLDPPRESARRAVDDAHRAGIRIIMVTGDHARTGAANASQVHLHEPPLRHAPGDEGGDDEGADGQAALEAHTGRAVHDYADEQLDEALSRSNVFARVEPVQKTRIVDRLKARNHIVAVTGDGVNDAPALKTAHLGAAMGSGTDVAKEASDMVITDDNFASVYAAVEQGRTAFRNIRMATFFLLSTGAADVLIILGALGLGWPLPLLPAQILWCNVVTNGIADVALAFEPGETALYRQPPRPPSEGVLDAALLERLVIVGVWLAVGVLAMFLWVWGFDFGTWSGNDQNLTLARTAALTTLVLFQKVHVFNCRSEDVSIFRKPLLANKLLFIGVMTSLGLHIAAVYIPLTQELLSLAPLDAQTWLVAGLVASTAIIVNELHKWLRPRYRRVWDHA